MSKGPIPKGAPRDRLIGRKEMKKKKKRRNKENKRKKKEKTKKGKKERKEKKTLRAFQIPGRWLNTIYPISLSSYRKFYPAEGPIPKSNLKLVISTKYLKYERNNGELVPLVLLSSLHDALNFSNLKPISLKKCNVAVLTCLKRMYDLGPIFPIASSKGPKFSIAPSRALNSIITSSKNFQFPIGSSRGPDFSNVSSRGPEFPHCVIKGTPVSPLRQQGHAPQLNNMRMHWITIRKFNSQYVWGLKE